MSRHMPPYVPNQLLGRLVDLRLFSVQFVHDYVQLRFDGQGPDMPVLNCDVMPQVEVGAHRYTDGDPGYADALRSLIPGTVLSTHEETGIGLLIRCEGGTISLHPTADEITGPEIALLSGFEDRHWMCWRPGEDSFEDLA